MEKGVVGSMHDCGVTESYKLKRQVILSASEASEMILRVDDSESLPHWCSPLAAGFLALTEDGSQSCGPHRGGARANTRWWSRKGVRRSFGPRRGEEEGSAAAARFSRNYRKHCTSCILCLACAALYALPECLFPLASEGCSFLFCCRSHPPGAWADSPAPPHRVLVT